MKKALLVITIILAVIVAGGAIGGYVLFKHYKEDPTFIKGTTLNGDSVAGETPEQIADRFSAQFDTSKTEVKIMENGKVSIEANLQDFGYQYDRKAFEDFLTDTRDFQRSDLFTLISTLMNGFRMTASESYLSNSDAISELVISEALAENRYKTVDNEIVFDEKENRYHIEEGRIGNEIDDAALQKIVKDTLYDAVNEDELPKEITIDIPKEVYNSLPPAGDLQEMQKECDSKNLELEKEEILDSYKEVTVTHLFGSKTEVLDHEIFGEWLSINDDLVVSVDEERVGNYVIWLKETYDTLYLDRQFTTTTNKVIIIPSGSNEYGYSIDYEAECAQLAEDILSKNNAEREPVYVYTNDYGNPYYYSRNGEDDLNGTYVEINLTKQHLWYYVDGELLVESDLVSGCVEKKTETQTGVFPLAFKKSPETLTGADAAGSNSYSVEVKYWMPFYSGQGMHDTTYRKEFGGNIYKKNGSHGCVNLPFSAAETIYQNIEPGVPIVIYKEK